MNKLSKWVIKKLGGYPTVFDMPIQKKREEVVVIQGEVREVYSTMNVSAYEYAMCGDKDYVNDTVKRGLKENLIEQLEKQGFLKFHMTNDEVKNQVRFSMSLRVVDAGDCEIMTPFKRTIPPQPNTQPQQRGAAPEKTPH